MAKEQAAREYTCAACRGTFIAGWSDEEAQVEASEMFGSLTEGPTAKVCDVCFREMFHLDGEAV